MDETGTPIQAHQNRFSPAAPDRQQRDGLVGKGQDTSGTSILRSLVVFMGGRPLLGKRREIRYATIGNLSLIICRL